MQIGIYANVSKDTDLATTKAFATVIKQNGAEILLHERARGVSVNFNEMDFAVPNAFFSSSDIIAVIGGDGTILRAAVEASKFNKPVFGVNMGKIGFLSECEKNDIPAVANALTAGKYDIEQRTLINVFFENNIYTALNELVVSRSVDANRIFFTVSAGEIYVDSYSADGFIVSTPTGSTAYSLSAGGPILSPKIKGLVLIPICSHSLHNRPIVIDDDEEVKIEPAVKWNKSSIVIDGKLAAEINGTEPITVKKSSSTAKFIRFGNANFYNKIFTKLTSWSKGE